MGIFKKSKEQKIESVSAPDEIESPGEIKHIEGLNSSEKQIGQQHKEMEYREIPVCMSQEQINSLVIENNIMLKQIISEMD